MLLFYSQLGTEIPSNARWLLGNVTHFHRFLGNLSTRTLHSLAGLFYVPNVSLAAALYCFLTLQLVIKFPEVHTNAFGLRQLLGISSAPHYGRSHRLRIALFSQLSWRVIDFSLHDYIATTSRGYYGSCRIGGRHEFRTTCSAVILTI